MASGDALFAADANAARQPATLYATRDVIVGASTPAEHFPVLDFDATTQEYVDFYGRLPANYAGGGLTLRGPWSSSSVAGGTDGVTWGAALRRIVDDGEDLDTSAHTYDYNTVNDDPPSAIGEVTDFVITFTDGTDMDSLVAGEAFIMRITRVTGDGGDTMTGDAELHGVYLTET
jgi:hypothetical protein